MKKPRAKVGDVVAIAFKDHCEGSDDAPWYIVYGRVAVAGRESYSLDSWALFDQKGDRAEDKENIKTFTLLRKVIFGVQIWDGYDPTWGSDDA